MCVKQVPDTTDVKIDPKTNTLIREGVPSILNPFDQFALEEAIRVKKVSESKIPHSFLEVSSHDTKGMSNHKVITKFIAQQGHNFLCDKKENDEIVVVSMGPPQTRSALMKCLALGADKAVLLSDRVFAGSDTFATSYTLAQGIRKIGGFDIIFCGQQAIDGDTAQVGPELATNLRIPQITYVEKVENIEGRKLVAYSQTDEGYRITEAKMPVLLTGTPPTSFEPKNPPICSIMTAKKKSFVVWCANDIGGEKDMYGLNGSPTQVIKVYPPPAREKGVMITDTPEIASKKLVGMLVENKIIK